MEIIFAVFKESNQPNLAKAKGGISSQTPGLNNPAVDEEDHCKDEHHEKIA